MDRCIKFALQAIIIWKTRALPKYSVEGFSEIT
jgi:hypothetical protein